MKINTKTYFRTHHCSELNIAQVGEPVKLSGFVHKIRDHGGLLFVDLRDHYGTTQCVLEETSGALFDQVSNLSDETVVAISGKVVKRPEHTENPNMPTGEIEVVINNIEILSAPSVDGVFPVQINVENDFPEDTRLTYRFLDLRREKMHQNIVLRSKIISYIRKLKNKKKTKMNIDK